MKREDSDFANSSGRVRLHTRRVALGATALALVVYLLACVIADHAVIDRLNSSINVRLQSRLFSLTHELPRVLDKEQSTQNQQTSESDDDLDDAPVLAWFVPTGSASARRLDSNAPALPADELRVSRPTDAVIAGRNFRLQGSAVPTGRIVVATSTLQATNVRNTIFTIEALLAPVLLLALFAVALIIGGRAAAPIERARRRQLEFTADASHELRTPLSVIEAEVGVALSATRSASAYRTALERVADESKRLRSIVDDLLWLARLDSLPEIPPHEPIDMASLATACADRFSSLALREDLTISVTELGPFPALILAPPEWLDRLVSVLLDNACRYTDSGGRIELTVSASDDRVVFTVDDDGPGIPEEEREHIMDRFRRASTVPGGAGLGLSIANAVVRATGGDWSVGSAPLGGARIQASWQRFRTDDEQRVPDQRSGESTSVRHDLVSPWTR